MVLMPVFLDIIGVFLILGLVAVAWRIIFSRPSKQ